MYQNFSEVPFGAVMMRIYAAASANTLLVVPGKCFIAWGIFEDETHERLKADPSHFPGFLEWLAEAGDHVWIMEAVSLDAKAMSRTFRAFRRGLRARGLRGRRMYGVRARAETPHLVDVRI
jgi:hemolysin-activating ACP:hemolysin acyltransferase